MWNLTFNWIFPSPLTCFLFRLINLSWDLWGGKQWGLLVLPVNGGKKWRGENPSGDKGWAGDRWRRSEHVSLYKYVQGYRRLIFIFFYLHQTNKEDISTTTLFTFHWRATVCFTEQSKMSLLSWQIFTHLAEHGEHVLFSIPGGWVGGGGVFWSAACALINLPKRCWRWKPWRAACSGSPEPLVQPEALLRRLLFFLSWAGRNLSELPRCATAALLLARLLVLVD